MSLTIACPGCKAPCDTDAVGPHEEDCPYYGPNATSEPPGYSCFYCGQYEADGYFLFCPDCGTNQDLP